MLFNTNKDVNSYYINKYGCVINNNIWPYNMMFPNFDTKYEYLIKRNNLDPNLFLEF